MTSHSTVEMKHPTSLSLAAFGSFCSSLSSRQVIHSRAAFDAQPSRSAASVGVEPRDDPDSVQVVAPDDDVEAGDDAATSI
jgi:hypothetical protein